jgi:hypothetical protein
MELRVATAIAYELLKRGENPKGLEVEQAVQGKINEALPIARAAIRSMRDVTPNMLVNAAALVDTPPTESQAKIATQAVFLIASDSVEDDQTAARGLVVDWAHLIDAASPPEDA